MKVSKKNKIQKRFNKSKKNLKGGSKGISKSSTLDVVAGYMYSITTRLNDNKFLTIKQKKELSLLIQLLTSVLSDTDLQDYIVQDTELIKDIDTFISSIRDYKKTDAQMNTVNYSSILALRDKIVNHIEEKSTYFKNKLSKPSTLRRLPKTPTSKMKSHAASAVKAPSLRSRSPSARASTKKNNSVIMRNLPKLNGPIKFNFIANDGKGNCFYYSLFHSMISLGNLLEFDVLSFFNECLDNSIVITDIEIFNRTIRKFIANKIRNNILFDLAKYNYENGLYDIDDHKENIESAKNNKEKSERQAKYFNRLAQYNDLSEELKKIQIQDDVFYNQLVNTYDDGDYRMRLSLNFNSILQIAPQKRNFLELFPNEIDFNNHIAEITETNYTFANDIHISILNLCLSKCDMNGFIFNIIPFGIPRQARVADLKNAKIPKTTHYISELINYNYKKKIITIPINKKGGEHYEGIRLDV